MLALAVFALIASWFYLDYRSANQAVDDDTLCLINGKAPIAALVMVDVTDRIAPANVAMIEDTIVQVAQHLPRASRIILVPFGDDTTSAFTPSYRKCVAPKGSEARSDENARMLDDDQKAFVEDLRTRVHKAIEDAPTSHTSPITQQVVRAASSATLGWEGLRRQLFLISDGLETGAVERRHVSLPKPDGHPLSGVETTFIEVGNRRDKKLQSERVRKAWKRWLEDAGASSTKMVAPGYVASEL